MNKFFKVKKFKKTKGTFIEGTDVISYEWTFYNNCEATSEPVIGYTSTPVINVGTTIYNDENLTIPYIGVTFLILSGGTIFNINALTGAVISIVQCLGGTVIYTDCTGETEVGIVYFSGSEISDLVYTDPERQSPYTNQNFSDLNYIFTTGDIGNIIAKDPCSS